MRALLALTLEEGTSFSTHHHLVIASLPATDLLPHPRNSFIACGIATHKPIRSAQSCCRHRLLQHCAPWTSTRSAVVRARAFSDGAQHQDHRMTPLKWDPQHQLHGIFINRASSATQEAAKDLTRRHTMVRLWILEKHGGIVFGNVYDAKHFERLLADVPCWSEHGERAATSATAATAFTASTAFPLDPSRRSAVASSSRSAVQANADLPRVTPAKRQAVDVPQAAQSQHDRPSAPFLINKTRGGAGMSLEILGHDRNDRNPVVPDARLRLLPPTRTLSSRSPCARRRTSTMVAMTTIPSSWTSAAHSTSCRTRQASGGSVIRENFREILLLGFKHSRIHSPPPWESIACTLGRSTFVSNGNRASQPVLARPHPTCTTPTSFAPLSVSSTSPFTSSCPCTRISDGSSPTCHGPNGLTSSASSLTSVLGSASTNSNLTRRWSANQRRSSARIQTHKSTVLVAVFELPDLIKVTCPVGVTSSRPRQVFQFQRNSLSSNSAAFQIFEASAQGPCG